jgi:hypothetical protein
VAYAVCTQALKTTFGASLQLSAPPGPLPPPNTQNPMASATQAQGSYGCAQLFGQSLVGSGFSKDGPIPAGLPISSFYPSFPNWFMILNSVPVPSIEGQFFNAGGQASIFPVCSS